MRCPKCGYISFDHVETCLKCKKDISGCTEVEGTTYHAEAPSFLRVPGTNDPEPVEESAPVLSINEDFAEDDYDFSDSDLDILVDENENEDEGTITFGDPDSDSDDFLLEPDDESEEADSFEFDLDDGLDFLEDEETASPVLNVPDELADISDLAPPVEDEDPVASVPDGMSLSLDDEMSLDEDLDLDGLDLDLGLSGDDHVLDTDLSLSLDDIDLSPGDIVEESSELDDLNMDLDLDGLDAGPAPEKEKPSGSLDGISLSLD
jgi:hypothetical protein